MAKREATDAQDRREQAAALIEQGRAQLDQGSIDEAIRIFDEATSLDEVNPAAWNDLAVALYQKGERELATGCLYTAMKVDPTFADAAINLATLLEEAGRRTDGVPGLRSVLFHDPDHEDVREMLTNLGVTTPRKVAIVAADRQSDAFRVIDACLTEWNHLIVTPDQATVGAFGNVEETSTWQAFIAAVRPDTLIVHPDDPATGRIEVAARTMGVNIAMLGRELPSGAPLVDLARALTEEVPAARESWDDIERPAPPISVLLQVTHIAHSINIFDRLATQDLAPGMFEVVCVDRAWGEAATSLLEEDEYGFDIQIIRAEGAGLGLARNLAMEAARGTWMLFFDEESRPAPDNVRGHLAAQVMSSGPMAILGDFRMHPNLVDNSLRKLIDTSPMLFAQPGMVHGTEHGGASFRANNLSIPRAEIDAIGGFDPLFSAGCEDTDLGVRLEKERGVRVRYDETLGADFDYAYTIGDVQVEQLVRGWACVHLARKHDNPSFLVEPGQDVPDEAWFAERRNDAEASTAQAAELARRIVAVTTAEEPYRKTGASQIIDPIVQVIGMNAFNRGIAIAASGFRLEDERMPGSLAASPTPVVVRPGGDWGPTMKSLSETEGSIVVYLPPEADVSVPEGMDVRRGGLDEALNDDASPAIAWIEAGTVMPANWRELMLAALEAWPDFGAVQAAVAPGPADNRPAAPPALVVHRSAIRALGDSASVVLDSAALANRMIESGYHLVQVEDVMVERGVRDLERAG